MKIKNFLPLILFFVQSAFSQSSFYFYSNKNILPDEEVQVTVSGYNLTSRSISFEIYRIKDPIKFITSKVDILNFKDESFEEVKDLVELVNSTEKMIETRDAWVNQKFNLGKVDREGTYLIRATNYKNSIYSFFTCSKIGLISKRSVDEVLLYISDRKTSEPLSNTELKLISLDKRIYTLKTDKNGIAYQKIGDRPEDRKFFVALINNNVQLLFQEPIYSPTDEYDKYLVYTYTNQPVYRLGQKVYFKSIIRKRDKDDPSLVKNLSVSVKVLMPDNSTLFDSNFTANQNGTINGSFVIPVDALIGDYVISIGMENLTYTSSFSVEEYKKPEYKVLVSTDKGNYLENDSVTIKVTAEYFFGEKLREGNVKLMIYRKPLVRYWWEFEPFANFYRGCFMDIIPHYQQELILETDGKISDGEFVYKFELEKELQRNYEYQVVAYVKDETNREVTGSQKFFVTKYNVSISANPDRYFYSINSTAILKVITTDFSFKPISKEFKIVIQKVHNINQTEYYEDIDTLTGKTQSDGIAYVNYRIKESGKFSYLVIIEDEKEVATARGSFYVADKDFVISGIREGLQIIPSKDVFNEDEEIEFLVISPVENVNLLVTLEQSKIYETKVVKLKGSSTVIKFRTKLPSVVHISASYYFENQYFSALRKVGILKNKSKLNVEIFADKNSYKPDEKGKFKVRVKDNFGNPVRDAELSSSIIDESIFSIKPDQTQNIFDFFSQSAIYKIYTSSMEIYSDYFYPQLRTGRLLYRNKDLISFPEKGRSIIVGKIVDATNNQPIQDVEVILVKDQKEIKATTDENGKFIFKSVPAGDYQLLIKTPFYENKIVKVNDVKVRDFRDLGTFKLFPIETFFFPMKRMVEDGMVFLTKQKLEAMPESEFGRSVVELQDANVKEFIEPTIRKDFKDAIYWNPVLITDDKGEVSFEVTFPDNLTSWRNSIKAITSDLKAGENFTNVIVRKNILIRVEVPRYINEKDEISLPVLVHNYSEKEQFVRVQLEVKNGELINDFNERMNQRIINPAFKEFSIKPDEVFKSSWRIIVNENVDTLIVTAKALVLKTDDKDVESDGVELKIPVEPQGIPVVAVKNFSLSKSKDSYSTEFEVKDLSPKHRVILKLSPTLIGNILSSLDELVGYPYGCVEQTMSRFLPSIIVANLLNDLKIELKSKTFDELPEIVKAGLKRLKNFQHQDGGWGWWEGDQTNPFMTAYVMYGLALTKSAGYQVDRDVLSRGLDILQKFVEDKKIDSQTRTYILFALSEAQKFDDDKNIRRELIKQKFYELIAYKNDPFVLSYLLQIAIQNGFDDKVGELKKSLLKLAKVQGNMVYWGESSNSWRLMDDRIEITANALKSLIMTGEKSDLIENAIRWLMYQKTGNFWMSTKQTATVIFSLVDYLRTSSELEANFSVDIKVNDKLINSFNFSKQTIASKEIVIDLSSDLLKEGKNKLEITKSGKGKLYCSLIEKSFIQNSDLSDQNFFVERKYYKVTYVKSGEKFEKKLSEVKDTVKVGDRIFVELKVKSNNNFEYFMLEDPLVPGFEYMPESEDEFSFARWYYRKEFRDKKAIFFIPNYNQGEFTFSYMTYAQLPGKYNVPSSVASLMYYPEVRGTGKEKKLVIVE
jgi:uncharacterized protein YfaS (alpha-2-macroglobulin family)